MPASIIGSVGATGVVSVTGWGGGGGVAGAVASVTPGGGMGRAIGGCFFPQAAPMMPTANANVSTVFLRIIAVPPSLHAVSAVSQGVAPRPPVATGSSSA
jgi:hypothetical protein